MKKEECKIAGYSQGGIPIEGHTYIDVFEDEVMIISECEDCGHRETSFKVKVN